MSFSLDHDLLFLTTTKTVGQKSEYSSIKLFSNSLTALISSVVSRLYIHGRLYTCNYNSKPKITNHDDVIGLPFHNIYSTNLMWDVIFREFL